MLRALVVVCAMAAIAEAHPPRPDGLAACFDLAPGTYPDRDARDVPRNTKAWIVGEYLSGTFYLVHGRHRVALAATPRSAMVELDLPVLAANTTYSIEMEDAEVTRFTTGARFDRAAPVKPELHQVAIHAGNAGSEVQLNMATPSDAVALELAFRHDGAADARPFATVITPTRWRMPGANDSCLGQRFAPGERVCLDIRALDGAGNRSAVATGCAIADGAGPEQIVEDRYPDDPPNDRPLPGLSRDAERHETRASVVLGALGGGVAAGFVALVLFGVHARRRFRGAKLVSVEPELVKRVARLAQRRATLLAMIALAICALPLFVGSLHGETAAFVVAPGLALGVVALAGVSRSYWAGDRLHDPLAVATSDGSRHVFVVRADVLRSWLHASPRALAAALGTAVPKAIARHRAP